MSYVLSFISQKGGVGKSTLARLVARQYAADGYAVKIADLDARQRTSTNWAARRTQLPKAPGPTVPVQIFGSPKDALADAERSNLDLLIFDPGAGDGRISEIAKSSTFAVIPTTSSTDDLDPTIELARGLAKKAGLPRSRFGIALCRTTGSAPAAAAARELIQAEGFRAFESELITKPTYETALSLGLSVNETAYNAEGGLNERAGALARSIMDGLEAVAAQDQPQQQQGVA